MSYSDTVTWRALASSMRTDRADSQSGQLRRESSSRRSGIDDPPALQAGSVASIPIPEGGPGGEPEAQLDGHSAQGRPGQSAAGQRQHAVDDDSDQHHPDQPRDHQEGGADSPSFRPKRLPQLPGAPGRSAAEATGGLGLRAAQPQGAPGGQECSQDDRNQSLPGGADPKEVLPTAEPVAGLI